MEARCTQMESWEHGFLVERLAHHEVNTDTIFLKRPRQSLQVVCVCGCWSARMPEEASCKKLKLSFSLLYYYGWKQNAWTNGSGYGYGYVWIRRWVCDPTHWITWSTQMTVCFLGNFSTTYVRCPDLSSMGLESYASLLTTFQPP